MSDAALAVPEPADLTVQLIGGAGEKRSSPASWLVPAIISFIAAMGGGMLTAYTTTRNAHDSRIADLKMTAYADYANAQATYQSSDNDAEVKDANRKIHQASVRLALYGDEGAVLAMADFIQHAGRRPACTATQIPDVGMYESIRQGIVGSARDGGLRAAIAVIILGCDIPAAKASPPSSG